MAGAAYLEDLERRRRIEKVDGNFLKTAHF